MYRARQKKEHPKIFVHFYRATLCGLCCSQVSVCPSVRLFVTLVDCTQTAEDIVKLFLSLLAPSLLFFGSMYRYPTPREPLQRGRKIQWDEFFCDFRRKSPPISETYETLGHVVRLDDHTPAHRALSQVAAARTCSRFGPGWRRRPGRPRHSWIQPIGDGTPFSIRAEWSKARRRGHSGLTQRTSAVYAN